MRLVLQPDGQPLQVFDPIGQGLDVAEHHGGRAASAQAVPDPADLQPAVGRRFAGADFPPHPITTRISAPPPGKVPSPAAFSRTNTSQIDSPESMAIWSISGGLKPCTLSCGKRSLMSRSNCSYQSILSVGCIPPCRRICLPPRAIVSSNLPGSCRRSGRRANRTSPLNRSGSFACWRSAERAHSRRSSGNWGRLQKHAYPVSPVESHCRCPADSAGRDVWARSRQAQAVSPRWDRRRLRPNGNGSRQRYGNKHGRKAPRDAEISGHQFKVPGQ